MSLFLNEDVNTEEVTETETQEQETVFVEDATGLLSLTLESEMSWHNLEKEIMTEEYTAVLTEDEAKLDASKASLFQKAIAWFNQIWQSFLKLIKNLGTRLQVQFVNGQKFVKAREGKINSYTGGSSANIHTWKVSNIATLTAKFPGQAIGGKLASAVRTAGNTGTTFSADQLAKELGYESFASIDKALVGQARSESKSTVSISKQMVMGARADITQAKGLIRGIQGMANAAKTLVASGRTSATEGLQSVKRGDEAGQKKKSAAISTAKASTSVIHKILNVYVKLGLERYADSMAIIKAIGGGNPNAVAVVDNKDNGAKEKASNVKKEDLELTLEDFEDDVILDEETEVVEENTEVTEVEETTNEEEVKEEGLELTLEDLDDLDSVLETEE